MTGLLLVEAPDAPPLQVWDDAEALAYGLGIDAASACLRGEHARFDRVEGYGYVHLAPEAELLRCYGDDVVDVRLPRRTACVAMIAAAAAYFDVAPVDQLTREWVAPRLDAALRELGRLAGEVRVTTEQRLGEVRSAAESVP